MALIGLAIEIALAVEGLLSSPDEAFPIVTHILIIEGRSNRVSSDALRFLALLIRSEDTSKIKIIHCDMPILTREGRCPPAQGFDPLSQRWTCSAYLRSVLAPFGAVVEVRDDE